MNSKEKIRCDSCAEEFKSEIDLEAHLFNNKYCTPPVPGDGAEAKAKELYDKFYWELHEFDVMDNVSARRISKAAKQCALICVDEIIKNKGTEQGNDPIFWHRVRERILNL